MHSDRESSARNSVPSQGADQLLPLVYEELRRLAAQRLALERIGQTLQATALVHEVYLRLTTGEASQQFHNRSHFFAAAAEAMRRILIEKARARRREKRGGKIVHVPLAECEPHPMAAQPIGDDRLIELDDSLQRLALEDPIAARVVELRFFGDLGHEEIAETLNITVYAARQKWTYARAWLTHELR